MYVACDLVDGLAELLHGAAMLVAKGTGARWVRSDSASACRGRRSGGMEVRIHQFGARYDPYVPARVTVEHAGRERQRVAILDRCKKHLARPSMATCFHSRLYSPAALSTGARDGSPQSIDRFISA